VGSTPMSGPIRYGLTNGDYFGVGHPVGLCGQATQYTGDIDEVQIWSRALIATEIAKLATANRGKAK
jgi:hypothetical protein